MVKADAYNHGALGISYISKNLIDRFGVATLKEAIQLREFGICNPISIFAYEEQDLSLIKEYCFTPVAYNYSTLKAIINNNICDFELKIDSGMRRFGFVNQKDIYAVCELCERNGIKPRTIHTHFASPNSINDQIICFKEACGPIIERFNPKIVTSASSGIKKGYYYDGVRAGIIIYKNALTIKSKVLDIKEVKKGERVGYDGDFIAENDTKVAIVSGGYYDGIHRSYKGACVKIGDRWFKIVGKVSMDTFFVEIFDYHAQIGDEVVVLSKDNLDSFISKSKSTDYEVLTSIRGRGERIYKYYGKTICPFID